jgi:hypothetical protein
MVLVLLFIRGTNRDYMISSDSREGTASKKWSGGVEGLCASDDDGFVPVPINEHARCAARLQAACSSLHAQMPILSKTTCPPKASRVGPVACSIYCDK